MQKFDRLFNARLHEIVLDAPPLGHACAAHYCDPQNEQALVRRGLLQGPCVLPEHVYVCKYGQTHVCNENECMADGACLVSGATMGLVHEYSSYNPQDARTWECTKDSATTNGPAVKRRKLYTQLEHLIDTLFYSPKRKDIVAHWNRQKSRQAKKYKDAYVKACETKRKPVNLIQLSMIERQYNLPCPIESHPERNLERLEQYIGMTLQLVDYIRVHNAAADALCADSVCLGMLYKMQHGICMNDVQVLPADPWLVRVLPPINDLAKLGVDKKKINRGERLILGMYESVQRQGLSLLEVTVK